MKILSRTVLASVLLWIGVLMAYSQAGFSTVSGLVVDIHGAALSGARVTLRPYGESVNGRILQEKTNDMGSSRLETPQTRQLCAPGILPKLAVRDRTKGRCSTIQ